MPSSLRSKIQSGSREALVGQHRLHRLDPVGHAHSEITSRSAPSKLSSARRCPCSASHAPELERLREPRDDPLLHARRRAAPTSTAMPGSRGPAAPPGGARTPRRSRRRSRAGVGMCSTRVRPPSAAATSAIAGKRGRSITSPSCRCSCCQAGQRVELEGEDDDRPAARRAAARRGRRRGGSQWWIVTHAIAASNAPSSNGSASARASIAGAAPGGRCARIVALRLDRKDPAIAQARRSRRPRRRSAPSARRRAPRGCARRSAGPAGDGGRTCGRAGRSRRAPP